MGGGIKNENSSPFDQTRPNFVYIFCGPPKKLEMQKLATQNLWGGGANENSSPEGEKILRRWTDL